MVAAGERASGTSRGSREDTRMDGMYCCSYMRFAVRAGIVAAVLGLVLFAAASLAGAQTGGAEPTFTKDVLLSACGEGR